MKFGVGDAMWLRLLACGVLGVVAGVVAGASAHTIVAGIVGWIVAAGLFNLWTWVRVGRMDAATTRAHATREDGSRVIGHVLTIAASLISILGVGVLISASASKQDGAGPEALMGVLAIAAAWFTVHTMFTLRYAHLFYSGDGDAIDFNEDDDPTYADFAYLGFTIGMTYQVSDTDLKTKAVRHTALRHALLSFLLGAVVLASTINLVSQLASGGK